MKLTKIEIDSNRSNQMTRGTEEKEEQVKSVRKKGD
jgi:hypothetical protein